MIETPEKQKARIEVERDVRAERARRYFEVMNADEPSLPLVNIVESNNDLTPQKRWKLGHSDHVRSYQREYMRERRAAKKEKV